MTDPYATHLPLLKVIGFIFSVRNVLELGSGLYSTPLFCNPVYFSEIVKVQSYETDRAWAKKVRAFLMDNDILHLQHSTVPLAEVIPFLDLNAFDLIFVDDGHSLAERKATIQAVTEWHPFNLVLMHDYEQPAYQEASQGFDHVLLYKDAFPNTAILWNDGTGVDEEHLQQLNLLINLECFR